MSGTKGSKRESVALALGQCESERRSALQNVHHPITAHSEFLQHQATRIMPGLQPS